MLKKYIILALRQIKQNKIYSAINIVGLSVGLAACFCIMLFVNYQLSYDKHNEKLNDIYTLSHKGRTGYYRSATSLSRLAPELKDQIPEIKDIARWNYLYGNVKFGNENMKIEKCIGADPQIFNILTLPFAVGNSNSLKDEKDFIIINETVYKRYFKGTNPVGQIITFGLAGQNYSLNVIGVMKGTPFTSTFSADVIVPFYLVEKMKDIELAKSSESQKFLFRTAYTYILLNPGSTLEVLNDKLNKFTSKNIIYPERGIGLESFPLRDVYFHYNNYLQNNSSMSPYPSGNMTDIYIYSIAAVIILFIALINYMLLGIGRASLRTKEVCVRKVIGANRKDLFIQTATEAIVITFIALPFAFILLELLLPYLSTLFGREVPSSYFHNGVFLLFTFIITLLVGLVTGAYVSFYLSRFNPLEIMKNKFAKGSGKVAFRRIMISTQLVISLGLLFVIITVSKQLNYCKSEIKGFDKDNLIVLSTGTTQFTRNVQAFKTELKKNNNISDVSMAWNLPGSSFTRAYITPRLDFPDKSIWADYLMVDPDFIETMKLNVKEGASFRQFQATPDSKLCLINESAVKELGDNNPIGKSIGDVKIIGIVEDFHNGSFKNKIKPAIIMLDNEYVGEIAVRVASVNKTATLDYIMRVSKQFKNLSAMQYQYYDDYLSGLYGNENKNIDIVKYATIIILLIASMGLLGVSLFVTQQRVKEIGIRKVVGASVKNIYTMIAGEFIALVAFAAVVAFPLGYFIMSRWLENYVYKTSIDVWVYVLSAAIGTIVVMSTISYQAIKVSLINPVDSLKSE